MKITSSYGVEITSHNKIFIPTITIFREAVAFFIEVVNAEWDNLKLCSYDKEKMGYIERLTHKTKGRTVKYDFDTKFYKFPCYLRRAAINSAIGCVSSYKANLENWEKSGKSGNAPKLTLNRSCYPTLYNLGKMSPASKAAEDICRSVGVSIPY